MSILQPLTIFIAKDMIFVLIVLASVWFLATKHLDSKRHIAVFGILSLILSFVLSLLAAKLYYNPRPFAVEHFAPLVPHGFDNGFPSDHTLLSATIAAIIFCFNKKIGVMFMFLALCIGIARVVAGVHHGIDIIGSIGISYISVFTVAVLHRYHVRLTKKG